MNEVHEQHQMPSSFRTRTGSDAVQHEVADSASHGVAAWRAAAAAAAAAAATASGGSSSGKRRQAAAAAKRATPWRKLDDVYSELTTVFVV